MQKCAHMSKTALHRKLVNTKRVVPRVEPKTQPFTCEAKTSWHFRSAPSGQSANVVLLLYTGRRR